MVIFGVIGPRGFVEGSRLFEFGGDAMAEELNPASEELKHGSGGTELFEIAGKTGRSTAAAL